MIVINHEKRINHIGDLLRLIPGVNEVDPGKWTEAKKIKLVRYYIAEGYLEERHENSLKDMKPDAAIRLIKDTVDLALLEKWSGTSGVKRVEDAIRNQKAVLVQAAQDAADEAKKG